MWDKTEHEQLKEICDLIGYEYYSEVWNDAECINCRDYNETDTFRQVNVVEIIFTQEFMDKVLEYQDEVFVVFAEWLLDNLDNPVSYLYNLLITWKE